MIEYLNQLQLDKFIALEEHISQWETYQDINVWLRLNKLGFKNAVLNQVAKWISLFKTDLIDRVKNSLRVREVEKQNFQQRFYYFFFLFFYYIIGTGYIC